MNTCKTCKWWRIDGEIPEGIPKGWHFCQMAENSHGEKSDHPESLAIAQEADDYHAGLMTHKNFGCNQHKPE
jgi:hypothetical protein